MTTSVFSVVDFGWLWLDKIGSGADGADGDLILTDGDLTLATDNSHSLIQRLRLRKFDHSMIYVLIAGSYTPICLLSIPQQGGILMLILVWGIALFGVIASIFWIATPRWLSASLYLGMGWMALMVIKPLLANLPPGGLLWLLLGGIFYSVGAIFYALKWPGRDHPIFGFHEIFHFFVLAGSISHYCLIFCYLS